MSDMHSVNLRGFDDPPKRKPGRPPKVAAANRDRSAPIGADQHQPAPATTETHTEEPDFSSGRGTGAAPPQPPVRTESLITEATVKAIRAIDIAPHLRIQRINVAPQYSIANDGHLLSAEVTVKFTMIFPWEAE